MSKFFTSVKSFNCSSCSSAWVSAQVLDQTFAETQAQEQEEQLKDLTEEKNFDIPSNLVMARQPYEALEMSSIAFYPYLYLTNQNNEQLSIIGNEADPWKITATLKA